MKTIYPIDANVEHTGYSQGRQGQDEALYTEGARENNMAAGQGDQPQSGNKDDSMNKPNAPQGGGSSQGGSQTGSPQAPGSGGQQDQKR